LESVSPKTVYLTPEPVPAGTTIALRLIGIGPAVPELAEQFLASVCSAGIVGLGDDDRVPFTVTEADAAETVDLPAWWLPPIPDAVPGRAPCLGVGLTAPLFLRRRDQAGRHPLRKPTFHDLFDAAFRTLSHLFERYDCRVAADEPALRAAARTVRCAISQFQKFDQLRDPSTGKPYVMHGVTGEAVFEDVPFGLIPWLLWGGRLHVGEYRTFGAGSWRLMLE
jgi:hypothetical protein